MIETKKEPGDGIPPITFRESFPSPNVNRVSEEIAATAHDEWRQQWAIDSRNEGTVRGNGNTERLKPIRPETSARDQRLSDYISDRMKDALDNDPRSAGLMDKLIAGELNWDEGSSISPTGVHDFNFTVGEGKKLEVHENIDRPLKLISDTNQDANRQLGLEMGSVLQNLVDRDDIGIESVASATSATLEILQKAFAEDKEAPGLKAAYWQGSPELEFISAAGVFLHESYLQKRGWSAEDYQKRPFTELRAEDQIKDLVFLQSGLASLIEYSRM